MGAGSSRGASAAQGVARVSKTSIMETGTPSTLPAAAGAAAGECLHSDVAAHVVHTPSLCAGSALHEKDPSLVDRVDTLPAVDRGVADVGQEQFKIFQAMQAVSPCVRECGSWRLMVLTRHTEPIDA